MQIGLVPDCFGLSPKVLCRNKLINPKLEFRNPKHILMTKLNNSSLGFRMCFVFLHSYFYPKNLLASS